MKSPRYSKAALATTLKCCAALLIVCTLLTAFVRARRAAAEQRNVIAAQHIQAARARLEQANDRRALIDRYLDPYNRLIHEGLVQRFDRATAGDWFEAAIRGRNTAAVDSYVIAKDAPYTGPESAELSAFRIVSHPLEFTAAVADEDEFVELMSALETRVPGTTAEEACSLHRSRESGQSIEPLAVRCAMVWYEFAPSTGGIVADVAGT
jgi:hypothetical protein